MKLVIVFFVAFCALALGAPANDHLDKANANNPYVNDVIASNKAKLQEVAAQEATTEVIKAFNPKPAGNAFVRLIDDIFQIPIGVLQSVANLLTNPIKQILHPSPAQPANGEAGADDADAPAASLQAKFKKY